MSYDRTRSPVTRTASTLDAAPQTIGTVTARVRAEFVECPGMRLTERQACCLFGLDPVACASVLAALCDTGFLVKDQSSQFRKG